MYYVTILARFQNIPNKKTTDRHWKQTRNSAFWKNTPSYKMTVHTFHYSGTLKHVDGVRVSEANGIYQLLSTQRETTQRPKLFSLLIHTALGWNRTARKIFGPNRK
jgi:hypothetical protein